MAVCDCPGDFRAEVVKRYVEERIGYAKKLAYHDSMVYGYALDFSEIPFWEFMHHSFDVAADTMVGAIAFCGYSDGLIGWERAIEEWITFKKVSPSSFPLDVLDLDIAFTPLLKRAFSGDLSFDLDCFEMTEHFHLFR